MATNKKKIAKGSVISNALIFAVFSVILFVVGFNLYRKELNDANCKKAVTGSVISVTKTTERRKTSNGSYNATVYVAHVTYDAEGQHFSTEFKSDSRDTYQKGKIKLLYEEGNPKHCVTERLAKNKKSLYFGYGMMGASVLILIAGVIYYLKGMAKVSSQSEE